MYEGRCLTPHKQEHEPTHRELVKQISGLDDETIDRLGGLQDDLPTPTLLVDQLAAMPRELTEFLDAAIKLKCDQAREAERARIVAEIRGRIGAIKKRAGGSTPTTIDLALLADWVRCGKPHLYGATDREGE
jgi:hypothetical protein